MKGTEKQIKYANEVATEKTIETATTEEETTATKERIGEVCDSLCTIIGISSIVNDLAKKMIIELFKIKTDFDAEMFDKKAGELELLISKLYDETL